MLANASPKCFRTRVTIVATSAMPATSPAIAPMTLVDAFVRTGSRQAKQLAATSVFVSERPAHSMPVNPRKVATHRAVDCWFSALSIWVARLPEIPADSMSASSTNVAKNPSRPTKNSMRGTKKRKSRNAIALPTSVPAASRSR